MQKVCWLTIILEDINCGYIYILVLISMLTGDLDNLHYPLLTATILTLSLDLGSSTFNVLKRKEFILVCILGSNEMFYFQIIFSSHVIAEIHTE